MKLLLKIFLIGLLAFSGKNAKAQKLKVNTVNAQKWAGGICCKHGTNYFIEVQTTKNIKHYRFDTLWIDNFYFPLEGTTLEKIENSKRGKALLRAHTVIDTEEQYPLIPEDKTMEVVEESKPIAPTFEGLGLLVYYFKGKRKTLTIEKVDTWLEPGNYP